MDIHVNLDLSGVFSFVKALEGFEAEVRSKVSDLAAQAHLHIKEQVQIKLNTRRAMYDQALSRAVEVAPGIWVITLDASAVWIEEGMPAHSMVDDLLRKNAKTAADGSRYKVIPFAQDKGGKTTTPGQAVLNAALKTELKKRNIGYKSIERNADGSPKTGLLHAFGMKGGPANIPSPPRPEGTAGKPGWGKGAVGEPMQGPNAQGGSGGGTPLLQGVRIYQTLLKGTNKKGQQKASRSIMTFRVVSSKHKGVKWNYPGIEGSHFFEDAEKWAERTWSNDILPDILKRMGG